MIFLFLFAVVQVAVFSLIPFLVYVIKYKKVKGFLGYIGLKKSTKKANLLAPFILLIIAVPPLVLAVTNEAFRAIMTNPESATGKIVQMGVSFQAVMFILITAIIKTSLAEEILFRGFVAKRLIAITNFQSGNSLQALIFGLMHLLLFLTITHNPLFLFVIFIFPTIGAYLQTYLNEKYAGGSIIPGWIAHGLGNLVAYSFVLFVLS